MGALLKTGTVEKIVNGGFGLVRSEEGVVFLSYVIPGEQVRYRIKERAKGINWGELIDVIEPFHGRVVPECRHFGECGGCTLSHMNYEDQLQIKQDILYDALARIGKLKVDPVNVYPSPAFQYRARARLKGIEGGHIGFIKKGTNEVMEITSCRIVAPEIDHFITTWNSIEGMPFLHQLDLFFNASDQTLYVHLSEEPWNSHLKILDSFKNTVFSWKGNVKKSGYKMEAGGNLYRISPENFFQVNRYQWNNMLEIADSWLETTGTAIDLYTGSGFFIPVLMKYASRVIGIENSKRAVELAGHSFKNTEFLRIPVEKYSFRSADSMIIDPPRSGIPGKVLQEIIGIKPDPVVYISCSTATLARDLSAFVTNGYTIRKLNLIDMFPQTAHIETMAYLRLK